MTPGGCLNFEDLAQNTGSVDANDSHPSPPAKTSAKTTTLKRFAEVSLRGEGWGGGDLLLESRYTFSYVRKYQAEQSKAASLGDGV